MPAAKEPPSNGTTVDELSVEGRRLLAGVEGSLFGQSTEVGLGRFVLLDVLGRGGMSVVYRAYDPKLDRRVAVKVMSSADEAARARILREAQLLAQLSHPNVVAIHEVGEEHGEVFVAMEFVDGGTLTAWCERHANAGRARDRQLLALCHQAIDGLCAAHALGIVHRDIKPANLLVGTDGRLRIADFGLARSGTPTHKWMTNLASTPDHMELTKTGTVLGTPAYMPPEQFKGHADAYSDQFSFCVSFFEAWSGSRPFRGASVNELQDAIEANRIAEPSRTIPRHVASVLRRGLRANTADRFPDMRALGQALRRGERRRVIAGGGLGSVLVAGGIIAAVSPRTEPPCTDDRARVDQVLDPSRRETVANALRGSGIQFIEEVVERTNTSLDQLADGWAEQRLDACQQTRAPEPEQAALGRRRQVCLDDALVRIEESLAGIDTLSREAALYFNDYLGVLFDLADCRDPSAEFIDDGLGRELATVLRRGDLADALLEREQSQKAYEEVLARTGPTQLPRLRARAHLQLSTLASAHEDPEAARRHAVAALDEAQTSGDSNRIAQAWINLAEQQPADTSWDTIDLFLGRARRLDEAGALSESTAATLGLTESRIRLKYDQPTEAARLLRRAVERGEPIRHRSLAEMYFTLGMIGMMEGDLDAALADSQRALELAEDRYGPQHPLAAGSRFRLATVQAFRGEVEQAERTIDPAIELLARTPDYRTTDLIMHYGMRGDIRRNLQRFDAAREDYNRGIELALRAGGPRHPRLGNLRYSLAEMYWMQDRFEDALESIDAAVEQFSGSTMYDKGTYAQVLVSRAGILADLQRSTEAAQQLEEAVPAVDNAFPSDATPHIQSKFSIASVWVQLGEHARALAIADAYLDSDTKLDAVWRARMQGIRARALEGLGDDVEAARLARLALEAFEGHDLDKDRQFMEELLARQGDDPR